MTPGRFRKRPGESLKSIRCCSASLSDRRSSVYAPKSVRPCVCIYICSYLHPPVYVQHLYSVYSYRSTCVARLRQEFRAKKSALVGTRTAAMHFTTHPPQLAPKSNDRLETIGSSRGQKAPIPPHDECVHEVLATPRPNCNVCID
mgnify:CR=1 FL=1